jgi:hypothetical protein
MKQREQRSEEEEEEEEENNNNNNSLSIILLALFADDTCLYATDHKEGFVVRKIQRGLSLMET